MVAAKSNTSGSTNKLNKTRVYLQPTCYICGDILGSARSTINHIETIHGYDVPARTVGHNRRSNSTYEYVRNKNAAIDEYHLACSSCWFHCPEKEDGMQVLNDHVREEHIPQKVDITKEGEDTLGAREARNVSRRSSISRRSNVSRRSSVSSGKSDFNEGRTRIPKKGSQTPINDAPITQESAQDISTKLGELINLFKKYL